MAACPGCDCPIYAAAWGNPALVQHPACLALVDYAARRFWLIDATPAFPAHLPVLQTLVAEPEAKHFSDSTEIQAGSSFTRITYPTILRYIVKRLVSLSPARS